jgi:hypothetical protein
MKTEIVRAMILHADAVLLSSLVARRAHAPALRVHLYTLNAGIFLEKTVRLSHHASSVNSYVPNVSPLLAMGVSVLVY